MNAVKTTAASAGTAAGALRGADRRALRARAHALKPVVWIAGNGLTPGVMAELDRALHAHELIKIHTAAGDRAAREVLLEDICRTLGAEPVQIIGKTLVAFRARPDATPEHAPAAARRRKGPRRTKRSFQGSR
ncbi:MAG: YhbY family RNA-binding protein [Burkholderiales bacterium]|nr:YhbY family RNA-binding protein [Burkholderiales bacterium]